MTITVNDLEPTAKELTGVLGFQRENSYTISDDVSREIVVFTTGAGGPGAEVHVEAHPGLPRGSVGRGGVHHVAFRAPNDEQHRAWQARLAQAGVGVTEVIDRFYFHSIYFREPGGVLCEIATDGPALRRMSRSRISAKHYRCHLSLSRSARRSKRICGLYRRRHTKLSNAKKRRRQQQPKRARTKDRCDERARARR
ncbi:MAG: VOC family protein [Pyrinomonadaceae bacterium]